MSHRMARLMPSVLLLAWITLTSLVFILANRVAFIPGALLPPPVPYTQLLARILPLRYVMDLLSAVLGIAIFSAACISLGTFVMRIQADAVPEFAAILASGFLVGEIIYSLVFLTIISLYKLTPIIVCFVLALGLLLGLRRTLSLVNHRARVSWRPELGGSEKVILGLVLAVIVTALLSSAARLSYDASVDYFSTAKLMAVTRHAAFLSAEDLFPVSSLHPGVLFTALIQAFGDQAARLLSWTNGAVILIMGWAIAAQAELSLRARVWFLTLAVTTTAFVDLLGDGKVDLISTAPLVATVYWVLANRDRLSRAIFSLVGLLIGFAMISRPFNIALAVIFLLVHYSLSIEGLWRWGSLRRTLSAFFRSAAWMLPPLLLLAAFHLWQNWIWLGNPIAPLVSARQLNPIVPLVMNTSAADRVWWQWQFDPAMLNVYRLLYPFTVTFVNSPQSLGNVSSLCVGILPLLARRDVRTEFRNRRILFRLFLAGASTLAVWIAFFSTVMEIRYVLFLWLVIFLAAAQLMESASRLSVLRKWVAPLASVLLVFIAIREANIALSTYSPIDSAGQAHCYDNSLCNFLDPVNRKAREGDRIFVLNAFRYYLRPDLFACSSRAQEYGKLEVLAQADSADFWVQLYRQGFKYVTFETNYAVFHTHFGPLPSFSTLPSWLRVTVLASKSDELERVYQVDAMRPPFQPLTTCRPGADGVWQVQTDSLTAEK